jgi:hypothetical protein
MTSGASTTTSGAADETSDDGVADTGAVDCSAIELESCERAGCAVYSGTELRYDAEEATCEAGASREICASDGALPAPATVWGVDDGGDVVLLELPSQPFDLDAGGWSRCGCGPGDPFACFGCIAGTSCRPGETCSDVTDEDECDGDPRGCAWVYSTVVEEGTRPSRQCMALSTRRWAMSLPKCGRLSW